MKRLLLWLLLICCLHTASGQVYSLRGQVTEEDDRPVYGAQVFLDGTTKMVTSDKTGRFSIPGLKPGSYELVVTLLGYEPFTSRIRIEDQELNLKIKLKFRAVTLKEVVVQPEVDRKQNYDVFLKNFLGESVNAKQCTILNPEVLNLIFDNKARLLEADSGGEFLIIENKALGYRLKYLLMDFQLNFQTGMLSYKGKTVFEDLDGSPARMRRWDQNRQKTYLGSSQHFLTSVYNGSVDEAGYRIQTLIRRPNRDRPSDSVINANIRRFSPPANGMIEVGRNDSVDYWINKRKLPKVTQQLIKGFISIDSMVTVVSENRKELRFKDCLYVIYTGEREPPEYLIWNGTIPRPLDQPNYQVSVLSRNGGAVELDGQGNLADPLAVLWEGYWSFEKIGDMLPSDYSLPQNR